VRRALEAWFDAEGVRPDVTGEFDDSGLLEVFGAEGMGFFPAASILEKEIAADHRVAVVGRTGDVRARFYAISVERRLRHPAVAALAHTAQLGRARAEGPSREMTPL
jgi:LysR family transcriptional activator of nhaA